jgi:hypothetical protein
MGQRDLAHLALRHRLAPGITQHDAHLGARARRTHRVLRRLAQMLVRVQHAQGPHRLGHAVLLAQDGPKIAWARRISAAGVGAVP